MRRARSRGARPARRNPGVDAREAPHHDRPVSVKAQAAVLLQASGRPARPGRAGPREHLARNSCFSSHSRECGATRPRRTRARSRSGTPALRAQLESTVPPLASPVCRRCHGIPPSQAPLQCLSPAGAEAHIVRRSRSPGVTRERSCLMQRPCRSLRDASVSRRDVLKLRRGAIAGAGLRELDPRLRRATAKRHRLRGGIGGLSAPTSSSGAATTSRARAAGRTGERASATVGRRPLRGQRRRALPRPG
jgi:hypothetical protein